MTKNCEDIFNERTTVINQINNFSEQSNRKDAIRTMASYAFCLNTKRLLITWLYEQSSNIIYILYESADMAIYFFMCRLFDNSR